jgi:catechol 2,3-dioxygenase-like lactoylglutathione lyase family enzyme
VASRERSDIVRGEQEQPNMIKITGINHIAIAAPSQLAEMRRFYVDVLGIASVPRAIPKELEETIPGFWLDMPVAHTQIHVLESAEQAPSREHKPISIGPHTAYTVESVEDAASHLEAMGVPFERAGPVIVVVDPGGNTVELREGGHATTATAAQ